MLSVHLSDWHTITGHHHWTHHHITARHHHIITHHYLILQMQENMKRATHRDAVNSEQFFFRQQILPSTEDSSADQQEYEPMSIDAIINGKEGFHGLVPLVRMYVDSINMDVDTRCTVLRYLSLISRKASGMFVLCICMYMFCKYVCCVNYCSVCCVMMSETSMVLSDPHHCSPPTQVSSLPQLAGCAGSSAPTPTTRRTLL